MENDYTRRLLGELRMKLPRSRWMKIHGGAFQAVGLSDILGCLRGWFVSIEVKDAKRRSETGGGLTPHQHRFLEDIRAAGGTALVVYTDDDPCRVIEAIKIAIIHRGVGV